MALARTCSLCGQPLAAGARADARYCSTGCRVAAHRNPARVVEAEPVAPIVPTVTVQPLGWSVEGWVRTDDLGEIKRLHDELVCDEEIGEGLEFDVERLHRELVANEDFAGEGLEFDVDGPVARMFVAIDRLATAEEFARAVNEILAR